MQIPFPRPFHRNSFQHCFTRDNAAYVPKTGSPELIPPSFPNRAKMDASKFRCLELSVMNVSIIGMTSMIRCLTWCPGAGSISWRQGKGPKGVGCRRFSNFSFEKQTFKRFLPAKRFANFIFLCRCYLVLGQFGWNSSTKQYANFPDGQNLEIWTVCKCFCPWTHFHKSTSALSNSRFGQFRLIKVRCSGSWHQRWQANLERSMPWHAWNRSLRWQVHSETKCCKPRPRDIDGYSPDAATAHHQMQTQEDCCQCRKPIREEFYSLDECSLGMFCNAMEPFSMTATT